MIKNKQEYAGMSKQVATLSQDEEEIPSSCGSLVRRPGGLKFLRCRVGKY